MSDQETPSLDTLIPDIKGIFEKDHKVNQENLDTLLSNIKDLLLRRLEEKPVFDKTEIRVSKLGTKDRKLWYELHYAGKHIDDHEDSVDLKIPADLAIKFLYGDIIEELILFFAREAGHIVEGEQGEIDIDGVKGHRDCIIDGITVDIKSASRFAFQKFKTAQLHKDDPFGYIAQISSYAKADGSPYGAFLVMNKESGELTLLKIDKGDMIDPWQRVQEVRKIEQMPTPPTEKCYEPVPDGQSGNLKLHNNCSYCPFKDVCWQDANNGKGLRRFQYGTVREYVHIEKEPRVDEIIDS